MEISTKMKISKVILSVLGVGLIALVMAGSVYHLKSEAKDDGDILTQWQDLKLRGVLAINTHKSIYLENETAFIGMAVLDDEGHTICDAKLRLQIQNPCLSGRQAKSKIQIFSTEDGTIQYSGKCGPDNVTNVPDYFSYYKTQELGTYKIKLRNLDTNYEISDSFEVREQVPFEIERIGATRIYPSADYRMVLRIKANQDFSGEIIEQVPDSFEVKSQNSNLKTTTQISKLIIWQADWKVGETYELKYNFDAPDISPYLYLLGPLQIGNFKEIRQWQIASDITCGFGSDIGGGVCRGYITSGTTWNVPSDWNSSDNSIEAVGAGGNGAAGVPSTSSGGGGGGSEYRKAANVSLTAASTVDINIPSGGAGSAASGAWVKNGAGGGGTIVVEGKNGGNGSGTTAGSGGTGGTGAAANFDGGAGGVGQATTARPGGGGGGSAGPTGVGKNGGAGANTISYGGSGGGGSNGGSSSAGATATGSTGGAGGNGTGGTGGGSGGTTGISGSAGTSGGGGGGAGNTTGSTSTTGGAGGCDTAWDETHGVCGGGGGGAGASGTAGTGSRTGGNGGTYGGGGGGGGVSGASGTLTGGTGGQGIIVITYTPIPADTSPPTPNPMTFASAPANDSTTQISMTSTTGSDSTPPVNYLFTNDNSSCGSNAGTGGDSSSWQESTSYTDSGLQPNKCYGYTVTARDSVSPTPNTGTASGISSTYTSANTPGTPTLSGATQTTLNLTNDANSNPSSSPTTYFAVQVVTTSPTDSTWLNKWVNASGNPSATEVWMTDAQLDALTLQGLTSGTTYGVKVKARNQDNEETSLSAEGQGETSAPAGTHKIINNAIINDAIIN